MAREVMLNDCLTVLREAEYPVDRAAAASRFSEVTLLLADGEANLGELVSRSSSETFDSAADVEAELHNLLPREAVGEPYQSEGEG